MLRFSRLILLACALSSASCGKTTEKKDLRSGDSKDPEKAASSGQEAAGPASNGDSTTAMVAEAPFDTVGDQSVGLALKQKKPRNPASCFPGSANWPRCDR